MVCQFYANCLLCLNVPLVTLMLSQLLLYSSLGSFLIAVVVSKLLKATSRTTKTGL